MTSQVCLQSEALRVRFSLFSHRTGGGGGYGERGHKKSPFEIHALSLALLPSALSPCIPGVIFQTHMRFYWPIYSAPSFFLLLPPMTRRIWACTAGSGSSRRSGQRTDRRAGQSGVCIGGAGAAEFRCKKYGEQRHSGRKDMRKGIQTISE